MPAQSSVATCQPADTAVSETYGLGCKDPGRTTATRFLLVCMSWRAPAHQQRGLIIGVRDPQCTLQLLC